MSKAKKSRVFRISEIPQSWSPDDLKLAFDQHRITGVFPACRLLPSPLSKESCTAILSLDPTAPVLKSILDNPLSECLLSFRGQNLVIDQHFLGLTVVASPPNSEIKADVIAVHGLSGHAFGSWSYVDHQNQSHGMWLRDFLGEDIPNVRILVYGYEARLDKTTTMSRLLDYRRSFLGQLLNYRRGMEQRPLILFGHSFGGTLIAQALQSAKVEQEKPQMWKLLKSVCAIFFFAVPHKGLRTTELQQMTSERSEESKTRLLSDLEKDSETLRQMAETLATLSIDIRFVSIYEEQQTSSVAKNPDFGTWTSTGAPKTMVEESSAVLYLPNETRIPAVADHRNIVKHSYRDQRYHLIKSELTDIVETCPGLVAQTFTSAADRHVQTAQMQKEKYCNSTELQPFGIAFGFSGSSRIVERFEFGFHSTVADYETTEQTDPGFVQFRIQCLKFIAWAETMRAAWAVACTSGSLLVSSHLQLQLFDISTPLLKLVKEAATWIDEVRNLKDKYGSFETDESLDGAIRAFKGDNIGQEFKNINIHFAKCLEGLESFMTVSHRRELYEETSANVLASINDDITLERIENIGSGLGAGDKLANSVRVKRKLQQLRQPNAKVSVNLTKPLKSIQQSALQKTRVLTVTTYSENSERSELRKGQSQNLERVLLEWTYVDRRWRVPHIELAKERLTQLVYELSIPEKPSSLRILQTIGIVEDFRDRAKRFGIISRLPGDCDVLREPVILNNFFPKNSTTLSELPEPLLSERFRLALTIATAVHELHSFGWLHKEINSFNIAFLCSNDSPSISIQEPYMTGFGYARPDTEEVVSLVASSTERDIYKHPDLRREKQYNEGQQVPRFKRKYDIYSLGLVLVEIGLWDSVSTFNINLTTPEAFVERLVRVCKRDLGHRMGRTYRDVVIRCIEGVKASDTESLDSDEQKAEELMGFYWSVVRELAKCQCK